MIEFVNDSETNVKVIIKRTVRLMIRDDCGCVSVAYLTVSSIRGKNLNVS